MAETTNDDERSADSYGGIKVKGVPTISQQDLEADSITKAIREQIILKQMQALQNAIAREIEDEKAKSDFTKLNRSELNAYLRSSEGKEQALKALDTGALQNELAKLEVAGHKYIHENFKDNFRDIKWKAGPTTDSRTNTILDDDGNKICDLTEKTIKQNPVTITLADGTEKTVSSYRNVDFPKQLEGTGPLDIQMAVKDSNGKNIAASKAVYFTAHYDDSGKLQEVSTPMPLKFLGEGKDAIGYIERDGEIYTLPVTKGKYQEMMQEVARNNGMGLDLSMDAQVTAQAIDKTVTPQAQQQQQQNVRVTPEQTVAQAAPLITPKEPDTVVQTPNIGELKRGTPPPYKPIPEGWKKGQQQNAPLETPKPDVIQPNTSPPPSDLPPPLPDLQPTLQQTPDAPGAMKRGTPPPPPTGPMIKGNKEDKPTLAQHSDPADQNQANTFDSPPPSDLPPPFPGLQQNQDELNLDLPKGNVLDDNGTQEQNKNFVGAQSLADTLAEIMVKRTDLKEKTLSPIEAEALGKLKSIDDKDRDGAVNFLKDAIANGKDDYAAALIKVSTTSEEWIYEYKKNDLKEAYDHGMNLAAKQTSVENAEKIHRAAGAISKEAGVDAKSHTTRIEKNNVTIDPNLAKGGIAK